MRSLLSALYPNVYLLVLAGALNLCAAPIIVFIGGIIGNQLAPDASLATLPVALLVVGIAMAVVPVSRLMQRFGRKKLFIIGALWNTACALCCAYCISTASFWGFNVSVFGLGIGLAAVQQYRFAAIESVKADYAAYTVSFILLGGLISAYLGPELGSLGKNLLAIEYTGSFALLACASLSSLLFLGLYQSTLSPVATVQAETIRPLKDIISHSTFITAALAAALAYGLMSFIMTATPLSMHIMMNHSMEDTKWVIQSHILAMFLPSLFSGYLISRFGIRNIMLLGLGLFLLCILIALTGQGVSHYWWSLAVLGVAWNFLFVAGTSLLAYSHNNAERFKAQGFNDLIVFSIQAFASIASGIVLFQTSWQTLLLISIPFIAVLLVAMIIKQRGMEHAEHYW